jgi:hypothetical protein
MRHWSKATERRNGVQESFEFWDTHSPSHNPLRAQAIIYPKVGPPSDVLNFPSFKVKTKVWETRAGDLLELPPKLPF